METKIGHKEVKGVQGAKAFIVDKFIKLIDRLVPTTSDFITEKQKTDIKKLIQPGDLFLETNNEFPGWQILEKLFLKTDWTHLAMYMGEGKVAEATTELGKLSQVNLDEFLDAYHVGVVRPNYKTEKDKIAALQYMKNAEGRKYDFALNTSDESELYCSEAPYHALKSTPNPIILPLNNLFGRQVVSPASVLNNTDMELLWLTKNNCWKNQLSHYPLGVGSATGAGALAYFGTTIGHPVALGIGGAVAGFAAAWGVMRLIWPSKFKNKLEKVCNTKADGLGVTQQ